MMDLRYLIVIILFALLITGCQQPPGKPKPSREQNLADIYNPVRASIKPDYVLHHINDSLSVLYIRIFPAQLLFSEANEAGEMRARVRISFELRRLVADTQDGIFTDSASVVRVLNRTESKNSFFTGLPIKSLSGNKYSLVVNVYDEYRRTRSQASIIVDKTSKFTAQNYKLISAKSEIPVFSNTLSKGQQFRLQYNRRGYDSIYFDYYGPDYSLPRPVFSTAPGTHLKSYPDTSWAYPYSDTIKYQLDAPGTYVLKVDKTIRDGIVLTNFGEEFPRVITADGMLGPLVYLASSIEFRDLRMQQNRKLAIDNFWLGISAKPDAARELIKVYYNRVFFANLYFTSYKEGWKTDRGMIYIIFGAPNLLEIKPNSEKWTYFTGKNTNPIEFVFERRENLFTNLDYHSVREVSSNPYWRSAVQSWRKGKIYSSIN